MKKKMITKELKEAVEYLEKFIDNSKHYESTCVVFDGIDTEKNNLDTYVDMYLRTWVMTHLLIALKELEGD